MLVSSISHTSTRIVFLAFCVHTLFPASHLYPSLITWQKWHLIDYLDLENLSTYYSLIFTEFAQGQSRSCVQLCLLCRSFPKQDTTRQSEARGRSTITPHCFNPLTLWPPGRLLTALSIFPRSAFHGFYLQMSLSYGYLLRIRINQVREVSIVYCQWIVIAYGIPFHWKFFCKSVFKFSLWDFCHKF